MSELEGQIVRGIEGGQLPPVAGGDGKPGQSRSALRRAVELCFDVQDEARREAVIMELMAAGALNIKPGRRARGR